MNKIIDISQRLYNGIPVWPGDVTFEMQPTMTISPDCPVNVTKLTLSPHTGTHMDSPYHYSNDGLSTADLPLDPYLGKAQVIDATHSGDLVTAADIESQLVPNITRILVKTTTHFKEDVWPTGFAAMDKGAIKLLASRGVKLIGIDTPSMDPQDSKDMPAHQAISQADMRILESLVLHHVSPGLYELIALPLKISGCDGSPVRAVLRTID